MIVGLWGEFRGNEFVFTIKRFGIVNLINLNHFLSYLNVIKIERIFVSPQVK